MQLYNDQKGSMIIFALAILAIIVSIAVNIAPLFISRYRASLETASSTVAVYAADGGIEWCLYVNKGGPDQPAKPTMSNGATVEVYTSTNAIATCTPAESPLNHRSVGTYQDVSRSFNVQN